MFLLRDSIHRAIRHSILTCEYLPGQELREQVLAERFRVSRSPVRDSLLRLELEHLVTVLPRQGYRVNPITMSDAEEIIGLRLLVEPACAAAAALADEAGLKALDRFRDFPSKGFEDSQFVEYNVAFHSAIADLTRNKRLAEIALELIEHNERLVRVGLGTCKSVRDVAAEHDAIIDALQGRDGHLASRLSYEHAANAQSRIGTALGLAEALGKGPAEPPAATE
jgi:GntR family transcriptional regulator, rspAB operon transcriptional repressor